MNDTELATKMLEWLRLNGELKENQAEIVEAVLERKESFTTGSLTAKYFAGRRSLDWVTPALKAPQDVIDTHTETTITTDWQKATQELLAYVPTEISNPIMRESEVHNDIIDHKAVCKELGVEADVLAEGTPSVTMKVKE